jgi:hypothetical protein
MATLYHSVKVWVAHIQYAIVDKDLRLGRHTDFGSVGLKRLLGNVHFKE